MSTGGRLTASVLTIVITLQLAALGSVVAPTASAQLPEAYHTYQGMKEEVRTLTEEHAEIAEFRVVGASTAGLEIFAADVALNISDRSGDELAELPTLYVDGAHHGNEILSAEAAYYALERVLTKASEDPDYLEGKRLVVNPIVNPDGHVRDQRENTNGVDLNRNYPFHWGLYGTSDAPFSGTYRGDGPASETETQTNIELMESLNLYGYVTGHTGTYDIVLPWRASEDGEIPDWPLYNTTLQAIEEETGLGYRDPSGAGESHAWAYGKRAAFGLLPEVDEEQSMPVSTEQVEQRLDEVLQVYRIIWENLTHIGGELHLEQASGDTLSLHNDGWGPAYNVTLVAEEGEDLDVDAPGANTSMAPDLAAIPSGETATIPYVEGAREIIYERVTIPGEDRELKLKTLALPTSLDADVDGETEEEDSLLAVPAPGLAALAALVASLACTRRPRG